MNKFLLLSIAGVLTSFILSQNTFAQSKAGKILKSAPPEVVAEEDIFSALDMKMLHDRQIVQEMIWVLYDQSRYAPKRDNVTSVAFNEKDSQILENFMDTTKITYNITPELLKKADEKPFEAFKDLIRSAHVPKITEKEIKTLNQVDKKAVSKRLQMITESGPDIGAKKVPVIYNETQE